MPIDCWTTALSESTVEVLEKMFFTTPLEQAAEPEGESAAVLTARLQFRGMPSGTLTLRISKAAARSLASNFFGLEPDELSIPQVEQVIGELTNMLCGCLLSRVESAGWFELSSPELGSPADGEERPMIAYNLGDGVLSIGLELDESAN